MTKNFLGIEITGDFSPTTKHTSQWPREDLEPVIKALLDDANVAEFGWTQYTPYFNDGEPCVFGASGTWVRPADEVSALTADGSDEEDEEDEEDPNGTMRYEVWGSTNKYLSGETWERAKALEVAIEGGHFNDVLMDLFGDHAKVTVKRSGIEVMFYDHD